MTHQRSGIYLKIQIAIPFLMFAALACGTLRKFFTGDDVMNIFTYISHPASHWLSGMLHFWSSDWYRPFGGIVYLLLFKVFGFHPLPFKVVLLTLLALNLWLFLRCCVFLSGSWQIATWAALLFCYHAAMDALYLSFGTIYDIIGFACYFGALLIYARTVKKTGGRIPGFCAVVVLYLIGLCSKEIVVTLPGVLLCYALLCTGQRPRALWRSSIPIVICAIAGLRYALGKIHGPNSLANGVEYQPQYTLHRFAANSAHYIHELFFLPPKLPSPTAACWDSILMLGVAVWLRSRLMTFCVIAVVLAQGPMLFIMPRDAFAVYIAFGFLTLYFALLLGRISIIFRSPQRAFAVFLAASLLLGIVNVEKKKRYDTMLTVQSQAYGDFSRQLDNWNVHPTPRTQVLLMNDPFPAKWNGWDPMFIVNDRAGVSNITVARMRLAEIAPAVAEAGSYEYIIDFDQQWRLLKSPGMESTAIAARMESLEKHAEIRSISGLAPPSQDGWRSVGQEFSLRVAPRHKDRRRLELSFHSDGPVRLSVAIDQESRHDTGLHGPGSFAISAVLPDGEPHEISVRVESRDGTEGLIFLNSTLGSVE